MGKEKSNLEILKEIQEESNLSSHSNFVYNIRVLAKIAIEQENRIIELELTVDTLQRQIDNPSRC